MWTLIACDAGGPIQAGDGLCWLGPYISKTEEWQSCEMIAMQDAPFIDVPLQPLLVLPLAPEPLQHFTHQLLIP